MQAVILSSKKNILIKSKVFDSAPEGPPEDSFQLDLVADSLGRAGFKGLALLSER